MGHPPKSNITEFPLKSTRIEAVGRAQMADSGEACIPLYRISQLVARTIKDRHSPAAAGLRDDGDAEFNNTPFSVASGLDPAKRDCDLTLLIDPTIDLPTSMPNAIISSWDCGFRHKSMGNASSLLPPSTSGKDWGTFPACTGRWLTHSYTALVSMTP